MFQVSCEVSCEGSNGDGRWGLVGAVVVGRRSDGAENICDSPGEREGEDDPGDGSADGPEIYRQGAPEQEHGDLEHHRKALDGDVEMPLLVSV